MPQEPQGAAGGRGELSESEAERLRAFDFLASPTVLRERGWEQFTIRGLTEQGGQSWQE